MKKTMKAIGTIAILAALVFTLTTCSNEGGGGGGAPTPPKVSDFYGTWAFATGVDPERFIISSYDINYLFNGGLEYTYWSLDTATPETNNNPETKTDYPYGFDFAGKVTDVAGRDAARGIKVGDDYHGTFYMHTNKKSISSGHPGSIYIKQ
jgi:hypothetical protein